MHYQECFDQAKKDIETKRKHDFTLRLSLEGKALENVSVSMEQTSHDFLFGAYLTPDRKFQVKQTPIADSALIPAYRQRFAELLNTATIPLYWGSYEHEPGRFLFDQTDEQLDWCAANHITPKMHPLVWLNKPMIPPWVNTNDPPAYRAAVEHFARSVLSRYAGRVHYWEVVNETCHWGRTPQYDTIVNEVRDAFTWAREYLPKGHLVINDYGFFDAEQFERTEILLRVGGLTDLIDGVGFQSHAPRDTWYNPAFVTRVIERYHDRTRGKAIHCTEMGCSDREPGFNLPGATTHWTPELQADFAEFYYTFLFSKPQIHQITWWDVCRVEEFRPGSGLCDEHMEPKPAYHRLKRLIHHDWITRESGATDSDGKFSFRGFGGDYKIAVTLQNGRTLARKARFTEEDSECALQAALE